jgi:hypothetical protein
VSYRVNVLPLEEVVAGSWLPRLTIEEAEYGDSSLAQAYSRAKLLAGWPSEPNVRELTMDEYLRLREADNWHPPGVQS